MTSAHIMIQTTMRLVLSITILMGLAIIVATGHQLYEQTAINSNHLAQSLKKVTIDSNRDWQGWRQNSNVDVSSQYFVTVHDLRKHRDAEHYYTPGAKQLLGHRAKVKLTTHLFYAKGAGLLYRQVSQAHGIRYITWQRMNMEVAVLLRIITITIIIAIIACLISIVAVRQLASRITAPLVSLSDETENLSRKPANEKQALPVPTNPAEVKQLAQSFNHLLSERYAHEQEYQLFIMNATHELKTPIASVYSNAQLIDRHGRDHPEIIPRSIQYILQESRQMRSLINQLLNLSRADNGVATYPVNLSTTVETSLKALEPTLTQELVTEIEPDCWSSATTSLIEQIANNLVNNAAKYSPEDSQITVSLKADSGVVHLSVVDQGPGISQKDLPHIFDRFYRSSEVRGKVSGTGLGLAIVQQCVNLCNGSVKVSQQSPTGAKFVVTLPLVNNVSAQDKAN